MILDGQKLVEYGSVNSYYDSRLRTESGDFKHYDNLQLINGYSKTSPMIQCDIVKIDIGHPNSKWCDLPTDLCQNVFYYRIWLANPVQLI
jgi:hypothetical protein